MNRVLVPVCTAKWIELPETVFHSKRSVYLRKSFIIDEL